MAFLIILTLGSWDSLWFLKGLWFVLEFATHLSHCTLYLVVQSDSNHNSDSLGLTCAGNRPFCRFIPVGVKVPPVQNHAPVLRKAIKGALPTDFSDKPTYLPNFGKTLRRVGDFSLMWFLRPSGVYEDLCCCPLQTLDQRILVPVLYGEVFR